MTITVSEAFDTGPDGAVVTTGNTIFEAIEGDLAFFATPARSGFGLGAATASSGSGLVGRFPPLGLAGPDGMVEITAVSAWVYLDGSPTEITGLTGAAVITALDGTGSVGMSAYIDNAQGIDPEAEPGYIISASIVDSPPTPAYLPISEWVKVSLAFTGSTGRLLVASETGTILDYTHTFTDAVALTVVDLQVVNTDALPLFADDFSWTYTTGGRPVFVRAATRKYPRDDVLGSSPRRYPPTRAGRRLGGYR